MPAAIVARELLERSPFELVGCRAAEQLGESPVAQHELVAFVEDRERALDALDCAAQMTLQLLGLALGELALADVADARGDQRPVFGVQGLKLISTGNSLPSRLRAHSVRPLPIGRDMRARWKRARWTMCAAWNRSGISNSI